MLCSVFCRLVEDRPVRGTLKAHHLHGVEPMCASRHGRDKTPRAVRWNEGATVRRSVATCDGPAYKAGDAQTLAPSCWTFAPSYWTFAPSYWTFAPSYWTFAPPHSRPVAPYVPPSLSSAQ